MLKMFLRDSFAVLASLSATHESVMPKDKFQHSLYIPPTTHDQTPSVLYFTSVA